MIDIKDLREKTGMTQKEFATYFEIPLRTYENWEAKSESENRHYLKEYWIRLMEYKLKNEGLI